MDITTTFEEWDRTAQPPPEDAGSPIWRMRMYRMGCFLGEAVKLDAPLVLASPLLRDVAPQLYEAVHSISVNMSVGYPSSSGADRARFYEYSLKTARESARWYRSCAIVLPREVVEARIDILTQVIRMLVTSIPRERRRNFRPPKKKRE